MSEKKDDSDQDFEEEDQEQVYSSSVSPGELPEHQYSKEELLEISGVEASRQRPECLDKAYDTKDGKWDPERWWYASREDSPLTVDGKGMKRVIEFDRDAKRRMSANDTVERLKEEKDGIVLSPQRRSFVSGCHVQQSTPFMRQSSLTERDRDREDSRGDRDRERERDRLDRDRDRNVTRKIGSGRIAIDRDGGRDFSSLRDRDRDRDRDREHPWVRDRMDRDRDRDWDRERDRDRDDWDRDRDRRFDRERSDRFRRDSDRDYMDRNRDRDRRDRDFRSYDRPGRRRNISEDDEPEWFTGGPTSQADTIELKGFDSENQKHPNGLRLKKHEIENGVGNNKDSKVKSESVKERIRSEPKQSKDDDVFMTSSEAHNQRELESQLHKSLKSPEEQLEEQLLLQNNPPHPSENPSFFDLDEFLKTNLNLNDEAESQVSRFSRFFHGPSPNVPASITEDMLMPKDLLDDSRASPIIPSPHHPGMMHGMKAPPGFYSSDLEQDTASIKEISRSGLPYSSGSIPNSAGDNNASSAKVPLPASVTALFNRAVPAGSNVSLSSNSSFSAQDAEAQLKAMLFGGPRDSASSSGTASPAAVPSSFQKRVKTVAELEADMHQSSPKKTGSPVQSAALSGSAGDSKDMTAFNKFLIMINAASEANQNAQTCKETPPNTSGGYGMVPSHSEFSQAVLRNKEHQMHLLQQSMNTPVQGVQTPPPQQHEQAPYPHMSMELAAHLPPHAMIPVMPGQPRGPLPHHAMVPGLNPQAMSTPQVPIPQVPNAIRQQQNQSGATSNPPSSDPIFSMIQQNPAIIMKPASPATGMAGIYAATQPSGMPSSARVPSPIMFSQQPPLHLNAPSPIHPSQLSPQPLNSPNSRSPIPQRGLSPQEIAVHTQAVMQNALLKKQLQNQSERSIKKLQERAKSPSNQIKVVKSQPAAQPVLPPTPQPKGATVNTFTPTSVLVKMHSDKAIEKEKQAQEMGDKPVEYMPSMEELSAVKSGGNNVAIASHMNENHHPISLQNNVTSMGNSHASFQQGGPPAGQQRGPVTPPDTSDISFLDPINPNLVTLTNQIDNSLRINSGQINILPGGLSQPMSVEEKMKLSSLVEKPGYLSQILDAKAAQAESVKNTTKMGRRPIVRGADQPVLDEMMQQPPPPNQPPHMIPQQPQLLPPGQQQQQQPQPQPSIQQNPSLGRPVIGSGVMKGPNVLVNTSPPSSVQASMIPTPSQGMTNAVAIATANKGGGRAIVGSASSNMQPPPPTPMGAPVPMHPEMIRQLENQKQQQLQQHFQHQSHSAPQGGIVIPPPPPPGAIPFVTAGPPPHFGLHRVPILPPAANHALMQQHLARAGAMNPARAPHLMALQPQPGQAPPLQVRPIVPMSSSVTPGPLSPQGQNHQAMGSLSAAALSSTIQQVSSNQSKMNGPMIPSSNNMNGRALNMEMSGGNGGNAGIQRWFGSDILKTQLPSMPPLPTHSNQVMTVDELERN